jgi:hypothetical protein
MRLGDDDRDLEGRAGRRTGERERERDDNRGDLDLEREGDR